MRPLIIGIAGGTGSGKTTLVENLKEQFGADISVLPHDNYYAAHHDMSLEERQTQRAHSRAELRQWLKEAGFDEIRFYGRLRMTAPRPGDERWHVTARKAE